MCGLGLRVLKLFSQKRPDITIYLYGSNKVKFPISFKHVNLGVITLEMCNKLYQECQIGFCISASNPSRIPFEMMASGLPVVDIYVRTIYLTCHKKRFG